MVMSATQALRSLPPRGVYIVEDGGRLVVVLKPEGQPVFEFARMRPRESDEDFVERIRRYVQSLNAKFSI